LLEILVTKCIAEEAQKLQKLITLVGQEISGLLWYQKAHRVQKRPSLDPILSHKNPVHILQPSFSKIHFNIVIPFMSSFPSGFFSSGFQTEILYTFFMSHMRAVFLAYRILLNLIMRIIFGEEYK
jgi:hypothetical protein